MEYCCRRGKGMVIKEFIEPPNSSLEEYQGKWTACFGFSDMGGCFLEKQIYYCPFCGKELKSGK